MTVEIKTTIQLETYFVYLRLATRWACSLELQNYVIVGSEIGL
jgi:hypothetical protein